MNGIEFNTFCEDVLGEVIEIEDEIHLEKFLIFAEALYELANKNDIEIEIFPDEKNIENYKIKASIDIENTFYKSVFFLTKMDFNRYINQVDNNYLVNAIFKILVDNLEDVFQYS